MSNNFNTIDALAGASLDILTGNVVVANLFNNDIEKNFTSTPKIGDEVRINRRSVVVPKVRLKNDPITIQDIDETTITFKIQNEFDNSVEIDSQTITLDIPEGEVVTSAMALNYMDNTASRVVQPLAEGMVEAMESSILAEVANIPSTYPATPSSSLPNSLSQFSDLATMLNKAKAPLMGRNAIVNEDVYHSMITLLQKTNESGNSDALRNNSVGKLAGFNVYMSQYFSDEVHTTGTIGTASVTSLTLKGTSILVLDTTDEATGTYKKGDTLTIAGYGSVVVSADATAVANAVTVQISEPLRDDVQATSAVVTYGVTGGIAISYKVVGFFGVPDCIGFASIAPIRKGAGVDSASDEEDGYSLTVSTGFDIKQSSNILSIASMFGVKMLDGRLGVKLVQVVA